LVDLIAAPVADLGDAHARRERSVAAEQAELDVPLTRQTGLRSARACGTVSRADHAAPVGTFVRTEPIGEVMRIT